jgi:uncharacterized surface protein with fasciclin (FAS1) repeats
MKPLFTPINRRSSSALIAALCALGVAGLTACASVAPSPPPPTTIALTIAATPRLSTLNGLIQSAGLAQSLTQIGPYTVFAPSNEAFAKIPAATLAELGKDAERLRAVLSFHVVPSNILKAAAVVPGNVKSLQGANLAVSKAGDFLVVEEALVEQADVMATNGVIHIIDSVLTPPPVRR